MHNNKLIARIIGILFIVGTAAGIVSAVLTGPVLDSSDYLTKISTNETPVVVGSLMVLIMAFALAMIPVMLFPIFRKYNEILALGAVVFRGVLEAVLYITIAVSWLLLVTLSRDAPDVVLGGLLQGAVDWNTQILAIVFSLGALMIYWLFYVSKLIPRWLSIWGLAGAVLYLASPLLALFGLEEFGALMAPLALQEMVLAIWLIVKGFNPLLSDTLSDKTVKS